MRTYEYIKKAELSITGAAPYMFFKKVQGRAEVFFGLRGKTLAQLPGNAADGQDKGFRRPAVKLAAPGQDGLGKKGMGGKGDLGLGFQALKFEGRFGRPGGVDHNDPVKSRKGQGVFDVELETNFNGQLEAGLGLDSRSEFFLQAGRQGRPDPVVAAAGVAYAGDQYFNVFPSGRNRRSFENRSCG